MPTNKVKVEFWATHEQKKDFLWAINDIIKDGASDEGRAAQLLSAEHKSGVEITRVPIIGEIKDKKINWYKKNERNTEQNKQK